jgi:predicted metal-dependent enzyme (double-stranded beta helix superfamily)
MQGTRAWWEQKGRQAPSFNEGQNFLFIHLEMLFLQVNLFYVSPCVIGYFISHESTCVNTIFSGDILSAPKPSQSTGKKNPETHTRVRPSGLFVAPVSAPHLKTLQQIPERFVLPSR